VVVATGAHATYAAYSVNAAALNLVVTASRPCWIELRGGSAASPVVFEGTIPAGVSRTFTTAGSIWLRVGNPAGAKLTIDGFVVNLPSVANPFDVTVTVPA
jgi:hypothetical protein